MIIRHLLLVILVISTVASYKIAIFSPDLANSDVLLCKKIAETLDSVGHQVTVILYQATDGRDNSDVKISGNVQVRIINASTGIHREEWDNWQGNVIFDNIGQFDQRMFQFFQKFLNILTGSCKKILENKKFLGWLIEQEFDLAFATHYHACPIGLIHWARIPSWIWLQTGHLQDYVSDAVGVPIIPSYVSPAHLHLLDEMNFAERMLSFLMHSMGKNFYPGFIANIETKMFRELVDPDFPDLVELGRRCPLVMVNSNELYELPRPTLAKVVNIGGLGYNRSVTHTLPEEFYRILAQGKGTILVSLGTVAPSHLIPEQWKDAFLGAFEELPDYQVIFKYEGDDLHARVSSNVHIVKWMPQAALLQHNKTIGFLTHAGYNSLQEALIYGKPLITIGLFGDQFKNSNIAAKHGFGVSLRKGNMTIRAVYGALKKIIDNPRYISSARRMSSMVAKKPITAEHLLIKWTEFVAEFKTLENLIPAGQKLNFFQYYSLDWVEQFDVTLDRTIDEPYYAGDILKGIVEIFCVQQVKISGLIIRVTGVAETGWRNKTTDIVFESRHAFLDEAVDLTTTIVDHCNDEFQLLEGSHTINFQARLPLDVLSTITRENCGSVRYTCTALMGIPDDDTELIAEKTFTLFSVLNLDAPYLREPTTANEEEMMNGCCGHQVGSIAATLCIHEIGILPGETVRITLTIENKGKKKRWRRHKEKHECVLISLCQQLDFIAANRYDPKLIDRKSVTVAVETHGTCKARAGSGPETKEIEFKVPSALPPTSIHANRLVTCSYFFKLDLDHFDVIVPVVVGTIKHPGPV